MCWHTVSTVAPIGPPTNLEATPGIGSVTLMWMAPEQPNGIVTYDYVIINSMYDIVSSGMTMDLSVSINGLDEFTNYTFYVTARTSEGYTGPATGNFVAFEGSMYDYIHRLRIFDNCGQICEMGSYTRIQFFNFKAM